MSKTRDYTHGFYRRIYQGFVRGHRINSVSLEAEAIFWRMTVQADDCGNMDADERFIVRDLEGRRDFTAEQVKGWIDELEQAGLVRRYVVAGKHFVSICDFLTFQPSPNGKVPINKHPLPPWMTRRKGTDSIHSTESKESRKSKESSALRPDQTNRDQTTTTADPEVVAVVASLRGKPWNLPAADASRTVDLYGTQAVRVAMERSREGKKPSGLMLHLLREGIDPEDIPKPEPPPIAFASPQERRAALAAFREAHPGYTSIPAATVVTLANFRQWYESQNGTHT